VANAMTGSVSSVGKGVGQNAYSANAYGTYNASTFTTVSATPNYSTTIQKPRHDDCSNASTPGLVLVRF
jgi:hypothetical protein